MSPRPFILALAAAASAVLFLHAPVVAQERTDDPAVELHEHVRPRARSDAIVRRIDRIFEDLDTLERLARWDGEPRGEEKAALALLHARQVLRRVRRSVEEGVIPPAPPAPEPD